MLSRPWHRQSHPCAAMTGIAAGSIMAAALVLFIQTQAALNGDSAQEGQANGPGASVLVASQPPSPVSSCCTQWEKPLETASWLSQTHSSALEEKPGQCSPCGPSASSAGRAVSYGQQRPEPSTISLSPTPRPLSNPQPAFRAENTAHMFAVSKCPFSILGHS